MIFLKSYVSIGSHCFGSGPIRALVAIVQLAAIGPLTKFEFSIYTKTDW